MSANRDLIKILSVCLPTIINTVLINLEIRKKYILLILIFQN